MADKIECREEEEEEEKNASFSVVFLPYTSKDLLNNLPVTASCHNRYIYTSAPPKKAKPINSASPLQNICGSVCVNHKAARVAGTVERRLVIYISGKCVLKHLSIITQLQLKAQANVPPQWEQASALILFPACVRASPISRKRSTEMTVVARQWRGNSWCGHNWVTGSVCEQPPPPSTPPHLRPSSLPSISILSGGEVAFVMARG